jgi:Na+-driven multidrug efflux pump
MTARAQTLVLAVAWAALLGLVVWLGQRGAWVGTILGAVVLAFVGYLIWRSLQESRHGPRRG